MAKFPVTLGLDRFDVTPRREVVPASLDLLRNAEARQHALMTGHGGAPYFVDIVSVQTGSSTIRCGVQVPPGVLYCDIGLRLFGRGDITIVSPSDGTGTTLATRGDTAVAMAEHGEWVWTSGVLSSSLGAASGRALQVSSAVTWAVQDVELQLSIANVSTRCGIVGMMLAPIHLPV